MEKTIQIIHSSGGGGVGILVTTNVGASVSVSCEGQDTQTLTATDGTALFEDLAFGTWTVSVSFGSATTTETVEIYENIPCNLLVDVRLKDMPIGSKIRLGSGNTQFEILEKNHSGYPDNSVTLWTEILQRTSFGSSIDYRNSTLKSLCTNLYNTFSEREKEFVLLTDLPTAVTNTKTVVNIQDYVFALSAKELGANGSYCAEDGVKFNKFTLGTASSTTLLSPPPPVSLPTWSPPPGRAPARWSSTRWPSWPPPPGTPAGRRVSPANSKTALRRAIHWAIWQRIRLSATWAVPCPSPSAPRRSLSTSASWRPSPRMTAPTPWTPRNSSRPLKTSWPSRRLSLETTPIRPATLSK